MKKVIQLTLFIFLIVITIIFYKVYFHKKKPQLSEINIQQEKLKTTSENNLIKNLKYEVRLDQDNQYIISSDLSEITYENNIEIVIMQNVTAIFIDANNIPLTITSDKAIYNNSNYNTNFIDNIKIDYINNIILSDKMNLDFSKNLITIFGNVQYDGIQGAIKTDNIKINLITKKIDIYMDKDKNNVEIITKK